MTEKNQNIIKLAVFLGNPGTEYRNTRHNAGRIIAGAFTASFSLSWQKKFKGLYAQLIKDGRKIHLLQPETFMNRSGESLKPCMDFFNIMPEEILVVHDEIELPFGYIDIKKGGGLGGHNGLRSIVQHIGTRDFYRFRIGVSKPQFGDVAGYVLSNFSKEEKSDLEKIITESEIAVTNFMFYDLDQTLKHYRKKSVLITSDKN